MIDELRGIKHNVLNSSKEQNGKMSEWNAGMFQFILECKLKWLNLPVKYVDSKNSSRTCPSALEA